MYLFRQAFQTELSTFLLFWEGFKKFLLFVYSLWEYLVVPKRTEKFVLLEPRSTPGRWMVGVWLVLLGKLHRDPVGVLPSASSFFSAFNILLRWVSSLLMAAPRLRSISLEVEMPNFVATSRIVLGLYFSPKRFLLFFSNPCNPCTLWPGLF